MSAKEKERIRIELIEKVAEILINEFNIPWVRVTVSKPGAVRGSRDVGITIERGQEG